jgi:uncharacterized membrane protein
MSNVPYTNDHPSRNRSTMQAACRHAVRHTKVAMFWSAIVLPLGYLPLLIGGLSNIETTVFIGLIVFNIIALYIGHDHQPSNS